MKRNLILFAAFIVAILLAYNSAKRILTFRDTSQTVADSQAKLNKLKKENEKLKAELEYKQSNQFAEAEIRDKLGLSKPGEAVVILPQEEQKKVDSLEVKDSRPNYIKWRELFFGS